jgi:hypothetical protein
VSFQRKVLLLGSVCVALLVALVLGMVFSPRGVEKREAEALLFPGVKASAVKRVEVTDATTRIVLEKTAAWSLSVAGAVFPASQERAEAIVRNVVSLNRGTLISRQPQPSESLGFSPQVSKHLVFYGSTGELLCDLSVGKQGSVGRGVYLRAGVAPEVWQTGEGLSPYLTTDRTFWADLRVLPSDVAGPAVMRLSISSRSGNRFTWTTTRERDAQNRQRWVLAGRAGVAIKQEKVDAIVNAVTGLTGADFLTGPRDKSAFLSPSAVVVVSLTDNRTFSVLFGPKLADGRYPCMREQGEYVYAVPEWRLKEIIVGSDALMPGSP